MLNTNNSLFYKIFFTSLAFIGFVLVLEYKYAILPIHGIILILYLLITAVCTAWLTFVGLQNILHSNKPFKHEDSTFLQWILESYNFIQNYVKFDSKLHDSSHIEEQDKFSEDSKLVQKNLDNCIDDFISDVEKRFVLKWYLYVSNDPTFPTEAKVLLGEVVRHFLQVIVEVDGKKLIYGIIIVFLKHVREFRRTLKRCSKNNSTVEDSYRYSHMGSKSEKSFQRFVQQLTINVLRQFINWELWNSLPCRTLVSILSRKLTRYIITFISAPGFLNYQIVRVCASESTKLKLKLNKYSFISISDVDHSGSLQQLLEHPIFAVGVTKDWRVKKLVLEESNTPRASPKKMHKKNSDIMQVVDVVDSPAARNKDVKAVKHDSATANMKPNSRPKASDPVKIYESQSATKTWRNSSDLESISLGQDLLAFQEFADPNIQIQELIDKKLWKDNTADDEKASSMWDIPESWYGEEGILEAHETMQLSPTSQFQNYLKTNPAAAAITNTIKPLGNVTANTLHNMKELQQSTVNTVTNVVKPVSQATTNAMHKIGDLQDEAAGVVEGILDFGMTGLRKGLRLTGLQENFSELTQKAKKEFHTHKLEAQRTIDLQKPIYIGKITEAIRIIDNDFNNQRSTAKLVKTPHVSSEDKVEQQQRSSSESDDLVWVNPLNDDGTPSFEGDILLEKTPDSVPTVTLLDTAITHKVPQITEDTVEASPDLEYEEAQDFASTIAKLRYLLQQKSSESSFTTPSLSPMPLEEMLKTPADPPPHDITKADGAMPSLYKFCARTATGVFQNTLNTIKTALPGNVNEANQGLTPHNSEDWTFVETDSMSDDFYARMKRLLSERRAYCTVDTAYEAIDSLEIADKTDFTWTPPACQFDDELDEFDLQVPITKAIIDIICELIGDSNTYILRESVVKAVLLLIGNFTENFIDQKSESLLHIPSKCIGELPENVDQNVLAMKLEDIVKICKEKFPDFARIILGESTIEIGVQIFISSLQSQKINQDVFMQMLELFSSHLISACGKASPAYSA